MPDFNLPPGVTVDMIPGCGPDRDYDCEAWSDAVDAMTPPSEPAPTGRACECCGKPEMDDDPCRRRVAGGRNEQCGHDHNSPKASQSDQRWVNANVGRMLGGMDSPHFLKCLILWWPESLGLQIGFQSPLNHEPLAPSGFGCASVKGELQRRRNFGGNDRNLTGIAAGILHHWLLRFSHFNGTNSKPSKSLETYYRPKISLSRIFKSFCNIPLTTLGENAILPSVTNEGIRCKPATSTTKLGVMPWTP